MHLAGKALLFRVDGGGEIGLGHMFRCLALAQGWIKAGGRAMFVTTCHLGEVLSRFKSEGVEVVTLVATPGGKLDSLKTAELAHDLGASWIVIDGCPFDGQYQRHINSFGLRILLIDDNGEAKDYWADFILNQNGYADKSIYSMANARTRLLLGSKYILLRSEFLKWAGWRRKTAAIAERLLITLGGVDSNNVTGKVLRLLKTFSTQKIEARVTLGPGNPYEAELQLLVKELPFRANIIKDQGHFPEIVAWADLAICGAGTTSWECSFMGLPCCTIVLAGNQARNAEWLENHGVTRHLGCFHMLDTESLVEKLGGLIHDETMRRKMTDRAQRMVDGYGVQRVTKVLAEDY